MLIALRIWQAINPSQKTCDAGSISLQWPSSVLALSETNTQSNPLATFTDVDNVLSITLTNVNPIISLSTITPTTSLTTIATTGTIFPNIISVDIISTISVGFPTSHNPALSPSISSLSTPESLPRITCRGGHSQDKRSRSNKSVPVQSRIATIHDWTSPVENLR
jgi:hypothetical protein